MACTIGATLFLFIFALSVGRIQNVDVQEKKALDSLCYGIKTFSLELILRTGLETQNRNFAISPFSIWTMLSVLSEGAEGYTLDEMEKALRHPKDFTNVIRPGFMAIRKSLAELSHIEYVDSNTIFCDDQIKINKNFEKIINHAYFTQVHLVDFENKTTVDFINDFVARDTDRRIGEIVSRDDIRQSQMLLTNGVYFFGKWMHAFDKRQTRLENFHDDRGKVVGKVNMMYRRAPVLNIKSNNFRSTLIEVPFGTDDRLSMLLIIPNAGVKLSEVYYKFTKHDIFAEYESAAANGRREQVDLHMPRMKISTDFNMNVVLNKMGIYSIFDPVYSELPVMSPNKLHLSKAIHKTKIDVTEDGSEENRNAGYSHERVETVKANRPFLFLIIEKEHNFVLLGGVYCHPEVS